MRGFWSIWLASLLCITGAANARQTASIQNTATEQAGPSPRGAAWDIEAIDAFLRTESGSGDIVAIPSAGQEVFFHLRLRVDGPGPSANLSIVARLDGDTFCSTMSTADTGGNLIARCNSGWTATAGAHVLEWTIALLDLTEANTSNNEKSRTWNIGTEVDLAAIRVVLRTAPNGGQEVSIPALGQEIFFHLERSDSGIPANTTFTIKATLDDELFCSDTLTPRNGSALVWCNQGWTATAGVHTLTWTLDEVDAIAENDETNNEATLIWQSQVATTPGTNTPSTPAVTAPPAATHTPTIDTGPSATPDASPTPTKPPGPRFQTARAIIGDCNRNLRVAINELVTGVSIALGRKPLASCPVFDANRSFSVSIAELIRAVNVALNGAPEFLPPPDVLLQVVPAALLLDENQPTGTLRVAAFDSAGETLGTDDLGIEWVTSDAGILQIVPSSTDPSTASAEILDTLGTAFAFARLRDYPQIVSPPVSITRAKLHPEVQLVPDEVVVFPPPNLPDGVDLSNVSIPDFVPASTPGGEGSFGGFSESELASYFEATDDFKVRYPIIVTGVPPQIGQRLLASGGAPIAGFVIAVVRRGNFTLAQIEVAPPQELFEDIDFSISAEELLDQGLLQPYDTSVWEEDDDTGAATSGLFNFSVGPFDCKPPGLLAVRPTFTQPPVGTSTYFGPIWVGTLRMRRFTIESFYFKVGLQARAFFSPELRITPGVQAIFTCDLVRGDLRQSQIFPINGPLALVLAPYLEGFPSISFSVNVSGGPTARFGVNLGFDHAYWTGGTYTADSGWEPLCASLEDCSRTNEDAEVIWAVDGSGEQITLDGKIGLFGALEAGVAGAGGLLALVEKLPLSRILGGAVDTVLDKMKIRILRARVGPEAHARWHNARRTAFVEASEAAANVVLNGDLVLTLNAFDSYLQTALGLLGVRNIPLLEFTAFHFLEPFRLLNEETLTVDGQRISRGVSPVPIEVSPGQTVPIVSTVERDFVILSLTELFVTSRSPHQDFPHTGELWLNGESFATLDSSNDFTLNGSFVVTPAICDAAEQNGGSVEIKILAYNRMFSSIETSNFVGSFFVECTENAAPLVDAGPDQTVDQAQVQLQGSAEDDGNPDPPGALTIGWTASGPGQVRFANPSDPRTTATFPTPGTYILTLRADDGEVFSQDAVTIAVRDTTDRTPPSLSTTPCGDIVNPGETVLLRVDASDETAMRNIAVQIPAGFASPTTQSLNCAQSTAICRANFSIRLANPIPSSSFTITVEAFDVEGNRAAESCNFSTPPPTPTAGPSPTPTIPQPFDQPSFRKIIGVETAVPGFEDSTFQNWDMGRAKLVDGTIVFSATFRVGFNEQRGIFVANETSVQTVWLDNMILPGTDGPERIRVRTARNVMFDGTNIAFTAESGGPGGSGGRHVFLTTVGGQPIDRLEQGQMLSERASAVFVTDIRNQTLVGVASGVGLFFVPLRGGPFPLPIAIDENTSIPGGNGTFGPFDTLVGIGQRGNEPLVVFRNGADDVRDGVYLGFPDGSVELIANSEDAHPTDRGSFRFFFGSAFDDSSGDVAMMASAGEGLRKDGIFASKSGVLVTVADARTTVPGSTGLFRDLVAGVGFEDGIITFSGTDPVGLFAEVDGQLGKIAAPGDTINGQVVQFVNGLSDKLIHSGEVAVGLRFETPDSSFSGGIYIASFD